MRQQRERSKENKEKRNWREKFSRTYEISKISFLKNLESENASEFDVEDVWQFVW